MKPLKSACILLALALVPHGGAARAQIIVGPGVVPPTGVSRDTRFLPGTEIITMAQWAHPPAPAPTRSAVFMAGGTAIFEGGRYEGMSASSGPLGPAIEFYPSSDDLIVIYDGLIRGGFRIVNTPQELLGGGAVGIFINPRYHTRLVMFGGVVEGGGAVLASDPAQRSVGSLAIEALGYYPNGSRQQIDIYGGTLNGGVAINGISRFTVHGSDLQISPSPLGNFTATTDFTITGKYAGGAPFSHSVRANPDRFGFLQRTADSLTIEMYVAPEPSGMTLMFATLISLQSQRLNRRR